ncbi:DUF2645 family protein [Pectobacterium atrosepticum]|nr:DUF2645 family protein [Pectobacterium atrosepticum]
MHPFFFVKKSTARIITYLIVLLYYSWNFHIRFTLC